MWMGTGSSDVCLLFNNMLPSLSSPVTGKDTILDLINGGYPPCEVEWTTVSWFSSI